MRRPSQKTVTAFVGGVVTTLLVTTTVIAVAFASRIPKTDPDQVADQFGVTISWVDALDCGAMASAGGCYKRVTPDVIYVMRGLDEARERSTILHELGHVMQHRLGIERDECGAEDFARSLGATVPLYENCPSGAS